MIKKIITFSVLIAVILGQDEENSFFSLAPAKDVVIRLQDSLNDPSLLHKNICLLTDEDWQTIKEVSIQYLIDTQSVNYQTGSFNLTYLDEIANHQERDNFFASQCEESYNEEEDMDSKIAVIFKGTLLRGGECGWLPDKAEACKEHYFITPSETSPRSVTVIPDIGNSNVLNDTDSPPTLLVESATSSIGPVTFSVIHVDPIDGTATSVAGSTNYNEDDEDGDKKKRSRGSGKNRNRSHQKKSHSKNSHAEKSRDKKSHTEKSHNKKSHAKKSRAKKSHEEKSKR